MVHGVLPSSLAIIIYTQIVFGNVGLIFFPTYFILIFVKLCCMSTSTARITEDIFLEFLDVFKQNEKTASIFGKG